MKPVRQARMWKGFSVEYIDQKCLNIPHFSGRGGPGSKGVHLFSINQSASSTSQGSFVCWSFKKNSKCVQNIYFIHWRCNISSTQCHVIEDFGMITIRHFEVNTDSKSLKMGPFTLCHREAPAQQSILNFKTYHYPHLSTYLNRLYFQVTFLCITIIAWNISPHSIIVAQENNDFRIFCKFCTQFKYTA